MLNKWFCIFFLLFLFGGWICYIPLLQGQIMVKGDKSIKEIIEEIFIGKGVKVSNISFTGKLNGVNGAIGYYDVLNDDPTVVFKKGIILSTGKVSDAIGPNTNIDNPKILPGANTDFGTPGDADLARLVNKVTGDAAVLEFDFIPSSDTIEFKYIFASEEYKEYVGAKFNDIFAFYVTGPGFSEPTNIALIPGTNKPVSINTINSNPGKNNYYLSNEKPDGGEAPYNIQYDGLTKILVAMASVQRCKKYHLKIAITDVSDAQWDSAVFLEANSFGSRSDEVIATGGIATQKDTVTTYESCEDDVKLVFSRSESDISEKLSFTLGGTAKKDIDYTVDKEILDFTVGKEIEIVSLKIKYDPKINGPRYFTVKFKPAKACDSSETVVKILDLDARVTINPEKNIMLCSTRPDTSIRLTANVSQPLGYFTYTWKNKNNQTLGTGQSLFLTVNKDTTIYFKFQDNLCKAPIYEDSIRISFFRQSPGKRLIFNIKDTLACPGSSVLIDPQITGGRKPLQIRWKTLDSLIYSVDEIIHIENLDRSHTFILDVRDDCGNRLVDTMVIILNQPIVLKPMKDTIICQNMEYELRPEIQGSQAFKYQWIDKKTKQILSTDRNFTHIFNEDLTLKFIVHDSCYIDSTEVTVRTYPANLKIAAFVNNPGKTICIGDTATLSVVVSGGTGNYQFLWSTGETSSSIRKKISFEKGYGVIIMDGCQRKDTSVFIQVYPPLKVQGSPDTLLCAGELVRLRGKISGGNGQYSGIGWYDLNGNLLTNNLEHTITANLTEIFEFRGKDGCGELVRDSVLVEVKSVPRVSLPDTVKICAGNSILLPAASTQTSGCTFFWNPSDGLNNPFILNPTAKPQLSTMYSLYAVCNGCTSETKKILVLVNPKPSASFLNPNIEACEGDKNSIQLKPEVFNGVTPYKYLWTPKTYLSSDIIANPICTPLQSITYTLLIEDANRCTSEPVTLRINVNPIPRGVATQERTICENGSGVKLDVKTGYAGLNTLEYMWIPEEGLSNPRLLNPIALPGKTTTYSLVIKSIPSNCESDTIKTTVNVKPQPTAVAGENQIICQNGEVILGKDPIGAGPDYTFEWTPSLGLSDAKIKNPIAKPPYTTMYYLVVESNGCYSKADSVKVSVKPSPTVAVDQVPSLCPGQSIELKSVVGGMDGKFTYDWTPVTGLSDPKIANPIASPARTTRYTLRVSSENCPYKAVDSVEVTVLPNIVVDAYKSGTENKITVRLGEEAIIPALIEADEFDYQFEWKPTIYLKNSNTLNPIVRPKKDTMYKLIVTRGKCAFEDSILVKVIPRPKINVEVQPEIICEGQSTNIELLGTVNGQETDLQYTWMPATGLSSASAEKVVANPNQTQTYTIYAIDPTTNEQDTISLTVKVEPNPKADFKYSFPSGCKSVRVLFSDLSQKADFWSWDFGDNTPISNARYPEHTYEKTGDYFVRQIVSNTNGCSDTMIQKIHVHARTEINANFITKPELPATIYLPDGKVEFFDKTPGAISRIWKFGDGKSSTLPNPVHTYSDKGEFAIQLTVIDAYGCEETVYQSILTVKEPEIEIPNVFTPNDDGYNDTWKPIYMGNGKITFQIFDRWGSKVFETGNSDESWDGKINRGNPASEGVYFYKVILRGSSLSETESRFSGSITLIRK